MIIAATQYGNSDVLRYPIYTYTGNAPDLFKDSNGNWELVFKKSGNVTFQWLNSTVDIFLVGGGKKGDDGYCSGNSRAHGGNGGKGGACVTTQNPVTLAIGAAYSVTIGGSGQSTTISKGNTTLYTAASGGGSAGGDGGIAIWGGGGSASSAGVKGALAFGRTGETDADRTLYEASLDQTIFFGAGGGGGGAGRGDAYAVSARSSGGTTGGGNGGQPVSNSDPTPGKGDPGQDNTGSGGGGGGAQILSAGQDLDGRSGGLGGSGIVIIRNHRSS